MKKYCIMKRKGNYKLAGGKGVSFAKWFVPMELIKPSTYS